MATALSTHIFSVMNSDEWTDESFDVQPVEDLAVIIDPEEVIDNGEKGEIVFDTFRFNILGWTRTSDGRVCGSRLFRLR